MVLGSVVVVVLVGAFLAFRPDKLFVDDVVEEDLDADVAAAVGAAAPDAGSSDPGAAGDADDGQDGEPAGGAPAAPEDSAGEATTTVPPVVGQGDFVSQGGHDVVGSAFVVQRPEGLLLVLPELDAENGPDLQLYLSPRADGSVDGGVRIAPLKGNRGTQTYELPADVDLEGQPNVVILCERFATPFGTATLA
jgi:hypothetical protein